MLAIRPPATGGPEQLALVEWMTPTPGPTDALVRVDAAGVNFIDIYHRTGLYSTPLPMPIGLEGAGVVEAVGEGVTSFVPGERVAWAGVPGSYATHVVAPIDKLVKVPEGVDAKIAAGAMLQGMTAHYLTHSTYHLSAGDTCLVHAAAGGVGLLLCQMARHVGARAIGVVSTDEKAKLARSAGADQVVVSKEADFVEVVRQLTGTQGVDVVYDSVGKDTFERSLDCLRRRGLLVLYGQSSGPIGPVDLQILARKGSLFVTRPALGDYTATPIELRDRADAVFLAIHRGELCITIGATFRLADAAAAHRALEGRQTVGKVILLP